MSGSNNIGPRSDNAGPGGENAGPRKQECRSPKLIMQVHGSDILWPELML